MCSIMIFGQNNIEKQKSPINYENINKWDLQNNSINDLHLKTIDNKNQSQKSCLNSTLLNKQRLDADIEFIMDSNQWIEDNKFDYAYDAGGNITQKVYSVWNSIQWINENKYEFTYDGNGNVTIELKFVWLENVWFGKDKYEYTYDESGNITLALYYIWIENQWVKDTRNEYTYDVNGNMLSVISLFWSSNNWKQYAKNEFSYNISGDKTLQISYNSDGNLWEQANKWEYTYDSNGNLKNEIGSTMIGNQWELGHKEENSYDVNDNLTLKIRGNYNNNQWNENSKNEYTYDINNNRTKAIFSQMTTSHIWFLMWEVTSTYDSNGNPTGEFFTDYYAEITYNYIYTYDLSYSLSELIMPPNYDFANYFNNQIVNMPVNYIMHLLDDNENWTDLRKKECYYSEIPSAIYETGGFSHAVYPNPTNDYINIKIENYNGKVDFELLNIQGIVVHSEEISEPKQILLNKLPQGLYLYTIAIEGEKITGKLIIN